MLDIAYIAEMSVCRARFSQYLQMYVWYLYFVSYNPVI